MDRSNQRPTSPLGDSLGRYKTPIALAGGGTGQKTAPLALTALGGLAKSLGNTNLGPSILDANGKILASQRPTDISAVPTVSGNLSVVKSGTLALTITNYSQFNTYTIAFSAGTYTQANEVLTYTAPSTAQAVTLTINGKVFNITVAEPAVNKPTITAPVSGTTANGAYLTAAGSAFSNTGTGDTHLNTDWQLASDVNFTTIVLQSLADTTNKVTWSPNTALTANTQYYLRFRYRGTTLGAGAYSDTILVKTRASFTVTAEEAKLTAPTKAVSDKFGNCVGIDGTSQRVIVGVQAATENGKAAAGRAYIYVRSGTSWTVEATLTALTPTASGNFGSYVAISRDGLRAAVGEPGTNRVHLFILNGGAWAFERFLVAGETVVDFGKFVQFSGDGKRLLVGAPGTTVSAVAGAGKIFVFFFTNGAWTLESNNIAPNGTANGNLGITGAIDYNGVRLVVTAPGNTTNQCFVYVYIRNTSTNVWTQENNYIPASQTANGFLGKSVAINDDGDIFAVGEPGNTTNTGRVVIYKRTGVSWAQQATFTSPNSATQSYFGWSVSMDATGSVVAVGSYNQSYNGVNNSGLAHLVYRYNSTSWGQGVRALNSDTTTGDMYGYSVALAANGSRLAVSAIQQDPSGVTDSGAVYINN